MTSEKWKFVKHRKEKRKKENGKESEVYINGILCPSKRVKYEIGCQAFESTIAKFTSGKAPPRTECKGRAAYVSYYVLQKHPKV